MTIFVENKGNYPVIPIYAGGSWSGWGTPPPPEGCVCPLVQQLSPLPSPINTFACISLGWLYQPMVDGVLHPDGAGHEGPLVMAGLL